MSSKILSRRDLDFLLYEWLDAESLTTRLRFADHSRETFDAVLDLCEQLAIEKFATHNKKSDQNEPQFDGERVSVIPEVADALQAFADAGLVSAGMDYPGVGPEHAWLKDSGRAEYVAISDDDALKAFHDCCRIEGIIPALESSHAVAYACKLAPTLSKDKVILVNLSGRGDKDMHTVAQATGSEG